MFYQLQENEKLLEKFDKRENVLKLRIVMLVSYSLARESVPKETWPTEI